MKNEKIKYDQLNERENKKKEYTHQIVNKKLDYDREINLIIIE